MVISVSCPIQKAVPVSVSVFAFLCPTVPFLSCLEVGFCVAPVLRMVVLDYHLLGVMGHEVLMFLITPMFGQLDSWRYLEM